MFGGLRSKLSSADKDVQINAVRAVGNRGEVSLTPEIIALLDSSARDAAISTLGALKDVRGVAPLVALFRRQGITSLEREWIGYALVGIGHTEVVTTLLADAVSDPQTDVRLRALGVLQQVGTSTCTPALVKAAADADKKVREFAFYALCQVGDARAVPVLKRAIIENWPGAMGNAPKALERLGAKDATAELTKILKDGVHRDSGNAAEALRALGWTPPDDEWRARYLVALQDWSGLRAMGAAAAGVVIDTCLLNHYYGKALARSLNDEAVALLSAIKWTPSNGKERALLRIARGDTDGAAREGRDALPALMQAWAGGSEYAYLNGVMRAMEAVLSAHVQSVDASTLKALAALRQRSGAFTLQNDYGREDTHYGDIESKRINDLASAELPRRRAP